MRHDTTAIAERHEHAGRRFADALHTATQREEAEVPVPGAGVEHVSVLGSISL